MLTLGSSPYFEEGMISDKVPSPSSLSRAACNNSPARCPDVLEGVVVASGARLGED